jgi:hypothetical protein
MFWRFACPFVLLVAGCATPLGQWRLERHVDPPPELGQWNWVSAMPCAMPRAETVPPTVTRETLAALLGDDAPSAVRLASTSAFPATYQITHISGRAIHNYQEFHAAVQRAKAKPAAVLAFQETGTTAAVPTPVELNAARLAALEQATAGEQQALAVAEDGNPWVVLRQAGGCCKLTARVERGRGILQVVLSTSLVSGEQQLLPVEVRTWCEGRPLRCLTAAETLELLYQPEKATGRREELLKADTPGVDAHSFASVSERPDYRQLTSYRRLQEEIKDLPPLPALAVVPGTFYPGSPLLGDARALGAFLLQRELCQPGAPEQVGWILFADDCLKQGRTLQIEISHGAGVSRVTLALPAL